MINKLKKLTVKELRTLKRDFDTCRFHNQFDLFYEFQIPNFAFILLQGNATFQKRKKSTGIVPQGALFGLTNLLENLPSKVGLKVEADAEFILIPKSKLMEALNDKNSAIYQILKDALDVNAGEGFSA